MVEEYEKVVFVSHCIMNQSTRAWWGDGGASREKGMISDVVRVLMRYGIGMVQMDCPEFSLYGNPRPPRSKDGYDTPEFNDRCHEIALRACDLMECFQDKGKDPKIKVLAIIGVENSPSCGVDQTTKTVKNRNVRSPGRGLLIEALVREMHQRGLHAPLIGVSLKEGIREEPLMRLEALCAG